MRYRVLDGVASGVDSASPLNRRVLRFFVSVVSVEWRLRYDRANDWDHDYWPVSGKHGKDEGEVMDTYNRLFGIVRAFLVALDMPITTTTVISLIWGIVSVGAFSLITRKRKPR